jgi:hypothetical protein
MAVALTPEQKSYLRGKQYNLEKTARHGEPVPQNDGQHTAKRLALEDQVLLASIERDGAFAEATDTLEQEVREDLRQAVLQRPSS